MTAPFTFQAGGLSHTGHVNTINEDAWLVRSDLGVWAVADGMGGHSHGAMASHMVMEALDRLAATNDPRLLRERVEDAVLAVDARLRATAVGRRSPGTTVTVLLASGHHFAVLWAGDSRVYRRDAETGTVTPLTRDHSVVQEMIERDEISEEEAASHAWSHVITRAVGVGEPLVLDASGGPLGAGDVFLLCTDGLTRHVGTAEIAAALSTPPDAAANRLVAQALERGGSDNVTVVVVAVAAAADAGAPDPRITHRFVRDGGTR
jgi:serine/threonine protein phosphatase PrpC